MKGHLDIKRSPMAGAVQSRKAYDGKTINPVQPRVIEATPARKAVKIAPGINKGTDGQPDGAKRVINNEAKPAGRDAAIGKSTFKAPRNESRGSVTDCGYTPISMGEGAKGNGRGNGKR